MATVYYCTHRDVKDVYPQLDSHDTKTPLYGWVKHMDDYGGASGVDLWYAYNTGLVTELFVNGNKTTKITFPTSATTLLNGAISDGNVGATVDSETGFAQHDIVKIDNQYILLSAVTTNTLAWTGDGTMFNTQSVGHADDSNVYLVRDESAYDIPDYYTWFYDPNLDLCVITTKENENPNDMLMESGEDFNTLITRFRGNASRYLESRLDKTLPREQFKDKDGNYDYMIVRTTSLIAAVFLLQSTDQTSEVATSLWEEIDKNINELNAGNTKLSWMKTGDSSKGIIREVSVSGAIRIIKTRGHYTGHYDKVGVKITTAGVIGTATYSVWLGNSDRLGAEKMNQGESADLVDKVINGRYQSCVSGLHILFSGDTGDSAILNDKWEIEVYGQYESTDGGNLTNIQAVRR